MVKHNGVLYRAADAHAHIYPGKIAERATENVAVFMIFHGGGRPAARFKRRGHRRRIR